MHRLRFRPWLAVLLAIMFLAGHLAVFHVLGRWRLERFPVSGVVVAAAVLLIIGKHLGLLAVLSRFIHSRFKKQPRR